MINDETKSLQKDLKFLGGIIPKITRTIYGTTKTVL